jgi:hypothetical protein
VKSAALSVIAVALTTATTASAQGTEYLSYGASYTNLSFDGISADILQGNAAIDYRSNAFVVNGELNLLNLSDDVDSATISGIDARAGYFVVPNLVVYGGINYLDSNVSDSFLRYNVGAEYGVNGFTFGVNYNDSNETGYVEVTTLYASYQMNDTFEAAIGFTDTDGDILTQIGVDFDNGQYDVAAIFVEIDGDSLFGFDVAYDFGNSFRAIGNYTNIDGEGDVLSIGGGYEITQDMWLDVSVGRVDAGGGDTADVIGLAFTYETGNETLLIDRSETNQIKALGFLGQIAQTGGL